MRFIPLHTTNTAIVYKNSLCSFASLLVLAFIALSVMLPVLLVSMLSPYSGISESRVLYEQPMVQFTYEYIFVGTTEAGEYEEEESLIACSTFSNFNAQMERYTNSCTTTRYWIEDVDYDGVTDRAHFQLELQDVPNRLLSFNLLLFFKASLQHKCDLSPPSVLAYQLPLANRPTNGPNGHIQLKGELQLKQYVEFTCPFPGRNFKTQFRHVQVDTNATTGNIEQFKMESLLAQVKANPAYFQLAVQETYYRETSPRFEPGLIIELELDVLQVPARYHLSIWERLGQFWLYFASFFGISFYIMNKLKDFLFGRHIVRSWEIIPWKKLY
ncbi:transmembrane protein 231 [Drosophila eugracilis]|uniref:transmembrane protein 231 n=1 Tax=Drosophila eugracilis TaxID=29029 RepID=UPI0007E646BE|nr:transmembrane protein 231 [Drosophila eugracilis]